MRKLAVAFLIGLGLVAEAAAQPVTDNLSHAGCFEIPEINPYTGLATFVCPATVRPAAKSSHEAPGDAAAGESASPAGESNGAASSR